LAESKPESGGGFAVKQKRFSVEQIVAVLKQAETGVPLPELLRRVGVSEQTFYRWKKQYVGLEADQVRQLKQLQEENTRLKRVVADLTLDKANVAGCTRKKILKPSRRRQVVEYLHDRYRVSERRACRVARMHRATFRYRSHRADHNPELLLRSPSATLTWLMSKSKMHANERNMVPSGEILWSVVSSCSICACECNRCGLRD
jgi:putative transposase